MVTCLNFMVRQMTYCFLETNLHLCLNNCHFYIVLYLDMGHLDLSHIHLNFFRHCLIQIANFNFLLSTNHFLYFLLTYQHPSGLSFRIQFIPCWFHSIHLCKFPFLFDPESLFKNKFRINNIFKFKFLKIFKL